MQRPVPFGKYVLLDRISVGGMAEVFRAKTQGVEGFARIVAVKRILPHLAEDTRFVEMFIAEAKMASLLQHNNIAQVIELGRVGDEHFIAMEYVSGRDLLSVRHHLRKARTFMPADLAAYAAAQVAEGLAHAHEQRDEHGVPLGIVHRDVSPQNVLVSFDGAVKLIDFGIAKAATRDNLATRAGVLKGKFGYMTPEQIDNRPVDARSDLFSLGAVLHELLTNERLFDGDNEFITLDRVREAAVERPSRTNPAVPPALDAIVLRALAREPDDRFPNAGAMAEALTRFVYQLGLGSPAKRLREWMRSQFSAEIDAEHRREAQARRVVLTAEGQLLQLPDEELEEATALWTPDFDEMGSSIEAAAPGPPETVSLLGEDPRGGPDRWHDPPPPEALGPPLGPPFGGPGAGPGGEGAVERRPDRGSDRPSDRASDRASDRPSDRASDRAATTPPVSRAGRRGARLDAEDLDRPTLDAPPPPARWGRMVLALVLVAAAAGAITAAVLWLRPQPTELVLRVKPAEGLVVRIDGDARNAQSPVVLQGLKRGRHTLSIERPGYETWVATFDLEAGGRREIAVDLNPLGQRMLTLQIQPADATVAVDGRVLTAAERAGPLPIDPGKTLRVRAEREGYLTLERVVFPDEQPEGALELSLVPTPGQVVLTTEPPGAIVFLDGQRVGRTPFVRKGLDVRKPVRLRVEAPGHAPHEELLQFGEARNLQLMRTLKPKAP